MLKKTVCGTEINKDGYLILKNGTTSEKAVNITYMDKTLFFCEEICKTEFIEAKDKENWLANHK
jgi:YHS domain-containing protein